MHRCGHSTSGVLQAINLNVAVLRTNFLKLRKTSLQIYDTHESVKYLTCLHGGIIWHNLLLIASLSTDFKLWMFKNVYKLLLMQLVKYELTSYSRKSICCGHFSFFNYIFIHCFLIIQGGPKLTKGFELLITFLLQFFFFAFQYFVKKTRGI